MALETKNNQLLKFQNETLQEEELQQKRNEILTKGNTNFLSYKILQ